VNSYHMVWTKILVTTTTKEKPNNELPEQLFENIN
jgi:hypothetical protein